MRSVIVLIALSLLSACMIFHGGMRHGDTHESNSGSYFQEAK